MTDIKLKWYTKIILLSFLLVFFLSGCNKKEDVSYLQNLQETFTYTVSEETIAIAVNKETQLYTIISRFPWSEGVTESQEKYNQLASSEQLEELADFLHIVEVYDEEGNVIIQNELRFASGPVQLMTIANDVLYRIRCYGVLRICN